MTIEWRYTTGRDLGVLSLAGYLGADATDRFTGAIGWALARGDGPVILDLTGLLGWSAGGQIAVAQAARRLAESGRHLELAAIPADGSLVPDAAGPPVPVHCDLDAALAAHGAQGTVRQWSTDDWPAPRPPGEPGLAWDQHHSPRENGMDEGQGLRSRDRVRQKGLTGDGPLSVD